jgi:predicted phage-related endonuclease
MTFPPADSPKQIYDAVYRELTAARVEIERLRRENDALYDMMRGMKTNLTKILEGRAALEPKP